VYSPPGVLILERIDHIIEVLYIIRRGKGLGIRVKLSERVINSFKIDHLIIPGSSSPDL
jgi:hypothetical protein